MSRCVALYAVQLVMQTATAGGRPTSSSGSSTGGEGRKVSAAAAAAGEGETLEHLSAAALLQLFKLADATQQLPALFCKLPLDNGNAAPAQAQASSGSGDAAAQVAAAVMPRLPQLLACTGNLLQHGCFKAAQVMVDCLALLGKRLGAPVAASNTSTQQQQQAREPAYAALSRWAYEALQQEEPEVKSVPLVRGLLELFTVYHGEQYGSSWGATERVWRCLGYGVLRPKTQTLDYMARANGQPYASLHDHSRPIVTAEVPLTKCRWGICGLMWNVMLCGSTIWPAACFCVKVEKYT